MIEGAAITLRPVVPADVELLEGWENAPAFQGEYNARALSPHGALGRAFADHGLLTDDWGTLVVVTKGGEPVGTIGSRTVRYGPPASNRVYEIGIGLAPAHRGRGYGAAAQRLLAAYLFRHYPVERVQALTDGTNLAEQRALARAGFTREGTLRRAQFRNGTWHDLVVYSMLRGEEWCGGRRPG